MKENDELYIEPTVEVSGEIVSPMAAEETRNITIVICGLCCC